VSTALTLGARRPTIVGAMLAAPIRFYRRFVSPLKTTPTCRFAPTCSAYALEAIETRGAVVGVLLAAWRILRCNPLCAGGHDPVPPARARREE
jgi:putative membrane protein insertion efficiency factor